MAAMAQEAPSPVRGPADGHSGPADHQMENQRAPHADNGVSRSLIKRRKENISPEGCRPFLASTALQGPAKALKNSGSRAASTTGPARR